METKKKNLKKQFFDIRVPITSAKVCLYGSSEEDLIGRTLILDLTRSLRGKSFVLTLKVKKGEEELEGEPKSLELVGSYIRRTIRKGTDYVEDSFITECKDSRVEVKPFLMTRNKVSRAVRRDLRNEARKYLEGHLKVRPTKEVFSELTTNKLQRELSLRLKKVYPLAMCEIRVFRVVVEEKKFNEVREVKQDAVAEVVEEKVRTKNSKKTVKGE